MLSKNKRNLSLRDLSNSSSIAKNEFGDFETDERVILVEDTSLMKGSFRTIDSKNASPEWKMFDENKFDNLIKQMKEHFSTEKIKINEGKEYTFKKCIVVP
jgi:hypothetical protein